MYQGKRERKLFCAMTRHKVEGKRIQQASGRKNTFDTTVCSRFSTLEPKKFTHRKSG